MTSTCCELYSAMIVAVNSVLAKQLNLIPHRTVLYQGKGTRPGLSLAALGATKGGKGGGGVSRAECSSEKSLQVLHTHTHTRIEVSLSVTISVTISKKDDPPVWTSFSGRSPYVPIVPTRISRFKNMVLSIVRQACLVSMRTALLS